MSKSEIRDSVIHDLEDRVRKDKYSKYLKSMRLVRIRGFSDASVRFDFPVTALIGPNGAGKTTILGAAGLIYKSVPPRRFFAKSGSYDEAMRDWKIEYTALDAPSGSKKLGSVVTRTASYLKARWNRDPLERSVLIIGINRTLPASERKDLYKFVGADFEGDSETIFSTRVVDAVQKILGKSADKYLTVGSKLASAEIFAMRDESDPTAGYSEFHFGAGEASIIRIVSQIESAPDDCLMLIEEIENGLHPVAVRRLVEYLIEVAKRKSCQVVFTTHSNSALAPLPDDAVWSCYGGKATQGKLDVEALRTLTGEISCEVAVFAEDAFGALFAEVSLRSIAARQGLRMQSVQIHKMGGASPTRDHTRFHNGNPTAKFPAIAFVDGDKRAEGEFNPRQTVFENVEGFDLVYAPGDSHPEAAVFSDIAENLETGKNLLGKLTQRLMLDTDAQSRVRDSIVARSNTNRDPHVIFAQIGEDLDFLPEATVARAFVSIWCDTFEDRVMDVWGPALPFLPFTVADKANGNSSEE
ncbi:ATP-dependent endonuclease [Micrococcus sp. TA1]|uniref:ATP-dependent nuclease n=1 Tax=Micrococcus sp. TA1 TaxID=681627 RepID=UPI00183EC725|nr:AAA family ATPase [Micrococcus sp. TA1]MBB5747761.1 putative ATPase [Micrococcus sp. TA1]